MFRLDPGPGVQWYDVDYPAVIERCAGRCIRVVPDYHLVATSATDAHWLDQIPVDLPVLFIAEGVSVFDRGGGSRITAPVVDRFPSGEVQIDFFNWIAIVAEDPGSGSDVGFKLFWAVNSPQDILDRVPGLIAHSGNLFRRQHFRPHDGRLDGQTRSVDCAAVRKSLQYHRYSFGPVD